MILVDLERVSVSRPNRPLLRDVSLTVAAGDRLGVVGINGTGKSTLLSIIAGSRAPDAGAVRRGNGVSVASLEQVTRLRGPCVRDAVGEGWRGEAILDRLGVGGLLGRPVEQLSGGEEKRVALAAALVADADLLVLDEPTNHLDVDAIEWLEAELAGFRGGLVVVTHDRHVLDGLTTRIVELDRGTAHVHEGGYADYLEGRALREAHAATAEATRRNLARRELAWLRRGPKARTSKSRARVDRATELIAARPAAEARPGELGLGELHDATPRLGDQVIELRDVSVGFTDAPLVEGIDLLLDRRERLGVVGPNGAGKSTLLEVMASRREPLAGRVEYGATVRVGLYDQTGRRLDPSARVRNLVAGEGAEPDWWDLALMERFWFDRDVQHSPVELLSGGERRRLQLLLTLAERPNVLLLDEPTNDLDLDTLRALEEFLDEWPGAVVVVSHDRAFLERTVDDVLVVAGGRSTRWPGGYAGWLADRRPPGPAMSRPADSAASPRTRENRGRSRSTIRHELAAAEKEMNRLQSDHDALSVALDAAAADHDRLAEVGAQLADVADRLAQAEERWLLLGAELDSV